MPDLARFGAALLDGPDSRIGPEERALLFTVLTEKTEQSPPLGLGWRIDEDGEGRLRWHHAGRDPGRAGGAGRLSGGQDLSIALASNAMIGTGRRARPGIPARRPSLGTVLRSQSSSGPVTKRIAGADGVAFGVVVVIGQLDAGGAGLRLSAYLVDQVFGGAAASRRDRTRHRR